MVGYRPQLARSGSGFVTALVLPRGNAADSRHLVAMIKEQITNTGVIPAMTSADDGYSSQEGREEVLGLGVKVVASRRQQARCIQRLPIFGLHKALQFLVPEFGVGQGAARDRLSRTDPFHPPLDLRSGAQGPFQRRAPDAFFWTDRAWRTSWFQ